MLSKDSLWKGIVEDLFEELISFFYPEHTHLLDFSQIEFLDKELNQLFPESEANNNVADKLVKVRLKEGGEIWQLIHIEVQGYADKAFSERMFRYYYRTFDKYLLPLEALAVLTDPYGNYHPRSYQAASFKTSIIYQFHTYKLLEQDRETLENNANPFAIVLLTALESLQVGKDDESLFQLKIRLFRKLLERGYDKALIDKLTSFIKFYVHFNRPEMNIKFDQTIQEISQSNEPMGIVETILHDAEKRGEARGEKRGEARGEKKAIENKIKAMLLKNLAEEEVANLLEEPLELVQKLASQLKEEGKLK